MKLSRPPRLFGSSTTTTFDIEQRTPSPVVAVESANQDSKSKRQFPKSPLVIFKSKLSSRSSNTINHSSPSHADGNQQVTRRSDNNIKESAKPSDTEKTRPGNYNVEEVEEDPKKNIEFATDKVLQELEEDDGATVATQQDPLDRPPSPERNDVAGPPRSFFRPPKEVMIDPHAVPPSPMRDSTAMYEEPDSMPKHDSLLLDLGNNSPQSMPYCLGDPVGDIAMKRQILDAQRLVRVILGKPVCEDQLWLETSTILQAIRAFAMMKQELVELRKKHEAMDGDPPCILQELGSPIGTSTTGARTESSHSSFRNDDEDEAQRDALATTTGDSHSKELAQATSKVQSLEQQLAVANEIINMMKREREHETFRDATGILPSSESSATQEDDKYHQLRDKYQQLLQEHEKSVEESQRKLDDVIDSVASVPKRVLAKDSVREKLRSYCTAVANHATRLRMLEIEATMQREREESKRRLAELEERLRIQHESHQRQIEQLHSSIQKTPHDVLIENRDAITPKENLNNMDDRNTLRTVDIKKQCQLVQEEEKKIDT